MQEDGGKSLNGEKSLNYRGEFEIHLSVQVQSESELEGFRNWCENHRFKCVHIVLARGESVSQPMATWERTGVLADVIAETKTFEQEAAQQFQVTRSKVEASPFNEGVPQSAEEAARFPQNYFEHHLKVLRRADADRQSLLAASTKNGAHLSRNAFRVPSEGMEERFVTLRSYELGWPETELALQQLKSDLATAGEEVIECESEYCVFDSNVGLDRGWLPKENGNV